MNSAFKQWLALARAAKLTLNLFSSNFYAYMASKYPAKYPYDPHNEHYSRSITIQYCSPNITEQTVHFGYFNL